MDIQVREHGRHVVVLTIDNQPRLNAMSRAMMADLGRVWDELERGSCRAIVLTGAGDRAFCAGADLVRAGGSAFEIDFTRPRHFMVDLLRQMDECPLPLIARVNGHAMAGGLGLVCACDLAVTVDNALFGCPEPKVGISPMMILPHLLRVLPRRKLREMCLTGEPISAHEALQYDVVNYVVPAEELDTRLAWLLARIVDKSPSGLRLGKQALQAMDGLNLAEGLGYAQVMLPVMASTPDAHEGMAAFREKRAPRWSAARAA